MTVANRGAYRRPVNNEEAVQRDRRNGLPIHGEYGSQFEAKRYIRRRRRQKAGLMRQFTKQADGPCGNTEAFREGWDRIFGQSAKAAAQSERVRKTIGRGTRAPTAAPSQAEKTIGRRPAASVATAPVVGQAVDVGAHVEPEADRGYRVNFDRIDWGRR